MKKSITVFLMIFMSSMLFGATINAADGYITHRKSVTISFPKDMEVGTVYEYPDLQFLPEDDKLNVIIGIRGFIYMNIFYVPSPDMYYLPFVENVTWEKKTKDMLITFENGSQVLFHRGLGGFTMKRTDGEVKDPGIASLDFMSDYIPIRHLYETAGYEVEYDKEANSATISSK